jgi:hypothetical protein
MKSKYLELKEKHWKELEELRKTCTHDVKYLKIWFDHSCVGRGWGTPSVNIICRNCGSKKIMFRTSEEMKVRIFKTLKRQRDIKDQRLDCRVEYDWEVKD